MICTCKPMMSKSFRECPAHGTPDRSRWAHKDLGEIEVRGNAPAFIWFTQVGAEDQTQQKVGRADFLKKCKRLP
jgi:hypothetical protein